MQTTLDFLYSHRAKVLQQLSWARYAYQQELKKEPGKINPDLLSYQYIKIKDLEDKLEGTNITIYHAEMQAAIRMYFFILKILIVRYKNKY